MNVSSENISLDTNKKNPTNANAFNSLGDAYKQAGDKENAVMNLKKALTLKPSVRVKANSEKLLKELGETIE